ncbi:MAG: hypothetical protein QOC71_446, partial [Thermoplasmata archaeon]|nr:hypothetical protein [Thermoplasmata archaeon]
MSIRRTAKSISRSSGLALLGVLAYALAAIAAVGSPDFNLGSSPSSVTVAPGGKATYTLHLTRINGMTDAVQLGITTTLPAGVRVSFSRNPIPAVTTGTATNSTTMTVETNVGATTPNGTFDIGLAGSNLGSPKLTRQTNVS